MKVTSSGGGASQTPAKRLERLISDALEVAKKAKRSAQSLKGDNFYGNKLSYLRADAAVAFSELPPGNPGEVSALAELINAVFAAEKGKVARLDAAREAVVSLRTTWKAGAATTAEGAWLFPLSVLAETRRGYLISIGRQMNGCFSRGWNDAAAVMMRRLLEICLIEAFEAKGVAAHIKDANGDYFQLSDIIGAALRESGWVLSRGTKTALPRLRTVLHQSAHGRAYFARKEDLERLQDGFRVTIEELLRLAGLL